ncbi:hypothetical protein RJ639_042660 [Escallonia herrerae]|uniref:H15 domain-containing protein n=1 Tax=Escallonia herrerae TaxID=1293975 RepID=A0AA88WBE7_9ASTE|nr:hypothetical protein RJ639_042660 [Escallonia herrerae]
MGYTGASTTTVAIGSTTAILAGVHMLGTVIGHIFTSKYECQTLAPKIKLLSNLSNQMIFAAIDALKVKEGSNKSSISQYIESTYGDLPAGHANLLSDNLNKMKEAGELAMVKNNYLRPDPSAQLKRGRGRPPKAKDPSSSEAAAPVTPAGPTRGRGRSRKDLNAPPAAKKAKPAAAEPWKTGRPIGRPRKVKPQLAQNAVEAKLKNNHGQSSCKRKIYPAPPLELGSHHPRLSSPSNLDQSSIVQLSVTPIPPLALSANLKSPASSFSTVPSIRLDIILEKKKKGKRLTGGMAPQYTDPDFLREAGMIVKTMINKAVESKYKSTRLASETPEFQVFFNAHATNDFRTLFTSLPPEKSYFAAGVPGSFYGRLFPQSSLHIVHVSYALHWLSKFPEEVLDINSPAWNKGKIYYTSASDEIFNAYAAQFANDMNNFLNARAEEGLISESQVDALNLPVYTASPKEMAGLIKGNGHFSIEKMKLTDPLTRIDEPVDMQRCTTHIRAAVEGVLVKHFGCGEKMDEIFGRYNQKAAKYSVMDASYKKGTLLFVALKRK